MRALITGATGLLGRKLLPKVDSAVVLTRDTGRMHRDLGSVEAYAWDPETGPAPREALRGVDVVFNLLGEPVAGRWTKEKKRRIADSRAIGTRNLVAALETAPVRPRVLVSASAVGYYGDAGDTVLDEEALPGRDFMAEVAVQWEREALRARTFGVRVVCLRIGIVLAQGGGALGAMLLPFRMGVGGPLAGGKQWMPWIHIDDVIGLMLHAKGNDAVVGAVNAVAPNPVTNAEFARALGHAVHRPAILPVPKLALQVAFGEMSQVLFASIRAVPRAALRSGYTFRYTDLGEALAATVGT
ncbi:TIGR01777 family oxidoreductase [Pendulispora albinea]|uniref:TIGR01777 family oxidoreductase n=1 Tax=Pendulispora albinea TaxID=2741071 RepID=A0ABZ2LY38_9BACT